MGEQRKGGVFVCSGAAFSSSEQLPNRSILEMNSDGTIKRPMEVLPKAGLVYSEKGNLSEVLSKPKILPIKSRTLEKLEEMEKEAARLSTQGMHEGDEYAH